MQQTHWVQGAALTLISTLLVGGCATTKDELLPQDGPTMLEIYEGHFGRVGRPGTRARGAHATVCREDEDCDPVPAQPAQQLTIRDEQAARTAEREYFELVGYTRAVNNEIEVLFPTLPNPTLVMYVYPHLVGEEQMPVPGYATSFSMYSRTEYALPGEVSQQLIDRVRRHRAVPIREDAPPWRAVSWPVNKE